MLLEHSIKPNYTTRTSRPLPMLIVRHYLTRHTTFRSSSPTAELTEITRVTREMLTEVTGEILRNQNENEELEESPNASLTLTKH